jgi:integrase
MPRITKTVVDRLQPGSQIWDTEIKGFGVRCQGTTASFILKSRIDGRQRWINIGKLGSPWTADTARREALRLLAAAKQGDDIASQRQLDRRRATLTEVAERYLAEHGPKLKPRTLDEYERMLRGKILPALGRRAMDQIDKSDISKFHASMAATPRKANLTVAVLSSIIAWATDYGFRSEKLVNPCLGLAKFRENAKERYLSGPEITRLLGVLDDLEAKQDEVPSVLTAIRLLMLTGARLTEILTLKWQYIDRERSTLWLPDSKTGKKAIHLSAQALELLASHPCNGDSPYVITGRDSEKHLINLQKPWRRIRTLARLEDVRIHDLRHSYASLAINSGASLAMVGKLLGHRQPQTTMRYAHLTDERVREVNDFVGNAIASAGKRRVRPASAVQEQPAMDDVQQDTASPAPPRR